MNYFELHIGDLTEATAHLTMLEDGCYSRLMRKYYATEKPLPADLGTVQRLVGARSPPERAAVDAVLREFFELQDDGWHQSRCDAEIAAFHAKQAGSEGKREGAKERQRRARERRATLFEQLRRHAVVPAWTTTTVELETILSRVTAGDRSQPVTLPVTRDDTATQTPDSRHQTPEEKSAPGSTEKPEEPQRALPNAAKPVVEPPSPATLEREGGDATIDGFQPTAAGLACKAMRRFGVMAQPSDPRLTALLAQGATTEEFASIAEEAQRKGGKGFGWVLAALVNRRLEAAKMALAPPPEVTTASNEAERTRQYLAAQRQTPEQKAAANAERLRLFGDRKETTT